MSFHKNLSSSQQDDISFFLRQILLPSSSSSHNSMMPSAGSTFNLSASNDTDEYYDCEESEEGVEAFNEQLPTKSDSANTSKRTSSKRTRAAEVHNLSEKRRRSRINEKMKALQNLIPNSNKTDKASMLDEAIEYLKQLQLQVQMLSLRNGLNLHPMCFPEGLHSLPFSRTNMEFSEGNRSTTPLNMTSTLPLHQENPLLYASNLPNKNTLPSQPPMSYPSYTDTSFDVESQIPPQKRPHQRSSEPLHGEDILHYRQSNAIHSATNLLSGSQAVKEFESATMANNSSQTCIAERDQTGAIMRNSEHNIVFTSQLSQ